MNNYTFIRKPLFLALALLLICQALGQSQPTTAQQTDPPPITEGGYIGAIPESMAEQSASIAPEVSLSPDGGSCVEPAKNWTLVAPLPTALYGPAVASDGRYIYAAGGYGSTGSITQFVRYDPSANSWTALAPLPHAVYDALGIYAEGRIFVFGGLTAAGAQNYVQIYNIAANSWSAGTVMPGVRQQMGGGYYNGKIYVAGGIASNSMPDTKNQTWEYSIAGNSWQVKANLPSNVAGPGFGIIDGHLYLAGGRDETGTTISLVYNYDIAGNSWISEAPLLTAVNYPGSVVYNNRLWVFGGGTPFRTSETALPESPEAVAFTQVYDPATGAWQYAPGQNVARSLQAGAVVGNQIYSVGGYAGAVSDTVEMLTQQLTKVLIIYADVHTYPDALRRAIRSQAGIGQVDVFDGQSGTPTWSQLKFYDIVVPFSNNSFANAAALGDALADYIDLGGIVVELNFDWSGSVYIAGRFQTDGYAPFNLGSSHFSADTLGSYVAASPLMAGVTELNAYYRMVLTLSTGAVQVATWSDGQPLMAYKGRVVGINAYLGDYSGKWSGDYGWVIANAGDWLWLGNQNCERLACAAVNTIQGKLEATDLTQTGRLVRTAPGSSCGEVKPCPGVLGTDLLKYDYHQFINNTDHEQCITVTVDTGACVDAQSVHSSAYLGWYDPANLCTNYLADIGPSPGPVGSYSFNVPAWQQYTVVISEVDTEPICPDYTLTVSAGGCDLDSVMIPLTLKAGP